MRSFPVFLVLVIVGNSCNKDLPRDVLAAYTSLPEKIDFNFQVKPILSDKCYACHGPDEKARQANLRLDLEENALAALSNSQGVAIMRGEPAQSELIHRIFSETPNYVMPPIESELVLTAEEKAILYKWIEQGAAWKPHWAFIPPALVALPQVKNEAWCLNEIDYFIAEKHREKGFSPAAPASKTQWLRRVTFDITGLPPSPVAMADFLNDNAPNAYEKVVDKLLASPAYGEHMAAMWLDVARYSDSHGYQDDRPRTMWPWRDWVIRAFNDNLPFNEFATWQIAGDLLPEPTYDQKLATGFNRNHSITQEGGVVEEEYLTEYAADRTQTFSTAFLGLTMECARCHSHKYDPITQQDYYALFGFFNNVPERGQISYFDLAPAPNMQMVSPELDAAQQQTQQAVLKKEQTLQLLSQQEVAAFENWWQSAEPVQDLSKGLLTHFPALTQGAMNVNLPPTIPLPQPVEGKSSHALKFDGYNFLSLGDIGDFEWYNAFSLSGWIHHSNEHKKAGCIFGRRVDEQKKQGYDLVLTTDNRLAARLIHELEPQRNVRFAIEVETRTTIPPNVWNHIALTYDGSGKAKGVRLFVNGTAQPVRVTLDSLRNKTILNGNEFLIGNWNGRARELANLYGFKGGSIDEVKVFNRRLSELEIMHLAEKTGISSRKLWYEHFLLADYPPYRRIQEELDSLRALDWERPRVMIMQELDTVKATFVLERGSYEMPSIPVTRATPKAILAFDEKYPSNRLGLAQWLFDERQPLTGRVMVNRLWQQYFGKGLVATPEDFGNQGALPTHPELLDWLAVYFRQQHWDIKKMIRLMVLSATYRQDATITPDGWSTDRDNKWLARGPYQRLTAEMLRDQALATSGLLHEQIGGKWVKPYQPPGIWQELANQIGENKYRPGNGTALYRRSLYGYWKRTIPPPTMLLFDAAERLVCSVKRQQTSTPLQSLALLNNPVFVEASRKMAEQMMKQDLSPERLLENAFFQIVSRKPTAEEIALLQELYDQEQSRFNQSKSLAHELLQTGSAPVDPHLDKVVLAAATVVVNTMFNLDEAKYK